MKCSKVADAGAPHELPASGGRSKGRETVLCAADDALEGRVQAVIELERIAQSLALERIRLEKLMASRGAAEHAAS